MKNLKILLPLILLIVGSNSYAGKLINYCSGKAFVEDWNKYTDVSILFHTESQAIELYDISDDTESWVPLKILENESFENFDKIHAAFDAANTPVNLDPTKYDVYYTVEQVLGFPQQLLDFHGMIGGLKILSSNLNCELR